MLQTLVTYILVALAAAWVLWNVVLPTAVRRRLRPARARRQSPGGCADGCADCSGCGSSDSPRVTVRVHTGDRS